MSVPFVLRHIGPRPEQYSELLKTVGAASLSDFIAKVVPPVIRKKEKLSLSAFPKAQTEVEAIARIRSYAKKNKVYRSFIGMGYYGTVTPPVILRNILENPSWYTHYTPYQPEISQGRLEAILNYQTVVTELTGLDIANSSLLDEGTAAAEAMALSLSHARAQGERPGAPLFFISDKTHPQTIAVVATRAEALGVEVIVGSDLAKEVNGGRLIGALYQYPDTNGAVTDFTKLGEIVHQKGGLFIVATDLLDLTVLAPPSRFKADVAVGSSQRFGIPFGFGGPHAAFFAVRDDLKRIMPGRLVGVSKDAQGNRALRLALQTREQHIRREKATSNICTAQVLLAVMAGMYAAYHGPEGLKAIAKEVHSKARRLRAALTAQGVKVVENDFFDTLHITGVKNVKRRAEEKEINVRFLNEGEICVSLDETTSDRDLEDLVHIISGEQGKIPEIKDDNTAWSKTLSRTEPFLKEKVFSQYHSETEFLRYLKRLETKDLSLATAMIPLGSCTMKLNATSEMIPVTWSEFGGIHPFAPSEQAAGYKDLCSDLEKALSEITGFAATSLQPNSGSQGEYAGLLVVRAYHRSRGEGHRNICLIPRSAHGTNPASAAMAGMEVVVVECDSLGNVDVEDLRKKAEEHTKNLALLMVTYPSTHGVFEAKIKEICAIVHERGGQVYMDGANLNAQVGLCCPKDIGADVCHINLHKTFCIPHGGGGPGVGPIAVAAHLAPFLPDHPVVSQKREKGIGPISAAPWGSASILPISWMYMAMMGPEGLTEATSLAILNANYIASRLQPHYPVLYRGEHGYVAHECILDLRPLKKCGIEAEDVAKRLMDYGFHAPTLSFPVVGTLMIEPTESESKEELDRFCEAMIQIRAEIKEIEDGKADPKDNLLKNAPHTAAVLLADEWKHPYSRERAAFPTPFNRAAKFWPSVGRLDGVYGDRNLVCTCAPIDDYR